MKKERNFKVRFHNIDLPKTVYLVNAETHYELYERFGGILLNRGYYHTKASWRRYSPKVPTLKELHKAAFGRTIGNKNVRTYYFYPVSEEAQKHRHYNRRKKYEVAIEVIKLK